METPQAAAEILLSLRTSQDVTISVRLGMIDDNPLRTEVQHALRDACFDNTIIDQAAEWRIEHGVIFCPFMSDQGVRMAEFKKEVSAIGQALRGRSTRKRKQMFSDLDENNLLKNGTHYKLPTCCQNHTQTAETFAIFLSNDPSDRMSVNLWLGTPPVSCWVGKVLSQTQRGVYVEWYMRAEDGRFSSNGADCTSFYHGPNETDAPLCVFPDFDCAGRIPQAVLRQAQQAAASEKI